jgi:hypothetical protein
MREQPPPNSTPVLRYNFRWNDLTSSNANYVFEPSDQSEELPFLFQRCLAVDMPRKREIRTKKLCPFGLCPILHYNLALVAHLLGIQKAEDGKSYLQEAYRLYVRYGLGRSPIETMLGRFCYGGTSHGHLEQSGLHLHRVGYGRARSYPDLRSITQAIDAQGRIQQPIARLEIFVPQSRHYGKATIGSGCCLRTFLYTILIYC